MKGITLNQISSHPTPYYLYDKTILNNTINAIKEATKADSNFRIHYAIKANDNPAILDIIAAGGFGADCVSGGEIAKAVKAGFAPEKIVFAGVGKKDEEIEFALNTGIEAFNVESTQELEVINEIARKMSKTAPVALRINPNVDAHTHANITTGIEENKFGIALEDVIPTVKLAESLKGIHFLGVHFHIGSQVTEFDCFANLCNVINTLLDEFDGQGIKCEMVDVGGGLGIDYDNPDDNPIPGFKNYFATYRDNLKVRPYQTVHFELGRAVTAQCGSLITKVLFEKSTSNKKFAIVDAGFTDLIRPALYGAYHCIENLSSDKDLEKYDVVGPICESSDVFAKDIMLPQTHRGDFLAIRSAGAYGEVMASTYNARPLIKGYLIE